MTTKLMIYRFLSWPLPESLCSDPCASMPRYPHRTGTNLMTAEQAKAMLDYVLAAPVQVEAGLVEAASGALAEIQAVMQDAYNSATPVCCGRGISECCGSPDPEWSEHDQRTMDRFAPHELALRAALAAHDKQSGGE